jgi:Zn-dependent oligopeptidase
MKVLAAFVMAAVFTACNTGMEMKEKNPENPFFALLNEPVQYAHVTHAHIREYAEFTLEEVRSELERIRKEPSPGFENIFVAFDRVLSDLSKASNNCFMLYWVSPDSLSRETGLEEYQKLDALNTSISADSALYKQMVLFRATKAYGTLEGPRKTMVDDLIKWFEHAGAKLDPESLERFKELKAEINGLSAKYSTNMNSANEVLELDERGAAGLTENFRQSHLSGEGKYEIPVIPATRQPVLNNATLEETRKAYYLKYQNRAFRKNFPILDSLAAKRYELAKIMGYDSYASYTLTMKMARNPERVWTFLNDLVDLSAAKAEKDHELLKKQRNADLGISSNAPVNPWDLGYYRNQILKTRYQVDQEIIREYLPMEQTLSGMFQIFGKLLGVEIRKVEHPSVWHEEVVLYEVLVEGVLKGRFYLDLFPRPHKESWFYGVPITSGRLTKDGYEVPVCLLLANFTRPSESFPSLVSHSELNTLFHEFGHIMDAMSYDGEFSFQAQAKEDFVESMAQIFENWVWDYNILSTFTKHYKTGEVLPRELFDNMLKAKNITSGLNAQGSLRNCLYDMKLYDSYNPADPMPTDEIWREVDRSMALPLYVEGTHPQASWIHINTHPTYYYGYLWAEVYAQDMFTLFEKNGLTDTKTGTRYRKLILANGTQYDMEKAVEEFLGRPSNNEAYIKSLGL